MSARIRLREVFWSGQWIALSGARRLFPKAVLKVEKEYPQVFRWIEWPWVNLTGYQRFIPGLKARGIFDLPGDLLEIGAFIGVGTARLAAEARIKGKQVYAVDSFETGTTANHCGRGDSRSPFRSALLRGHSMSEVYERNIRRYASSIVTLRGDSKSVSLPFELRLCFAFIDGNHDAEYVRNDFNLAWSRLVGGGVIGFDDYGRNLPQVTETVDRLIREKQHEISEVWTVAPMEIFLRKAGNQHRA